VEPCSVTENYPNLKANAAFRDLRVELEGCENRISEARRQFNKSVNDLNNKVRTFPGVLVAGFAGVTPKVPFSAVTGADVAPTVKF
jgi:LemA protein